MKTLPRRLAHFGVALLFLAAAPLPVQAWAPKPPPHKEFKDPLTPYKKALSSTLSNFNKQLGDLVKGIKDGSVSDPVDAYEALWEALWNAIEDGDIDLVTAMAALEAAHPEDSIDGDPQGDLTRVIDVAHNLVDCIATAALEKVHALEAIKDAQTKAVIMLVAARIFDAYAALVPKPKAGVVLPPKQVSIGWTASGRKTTDADDQLRCGGLAPAGATVNVTVDCGPGQVMTTTAVADAKCRWKIKLTGVVPGNCQITASDNANAANNASRPVSVP